MKKWKIILLLIIPLFSLWNCSAWRKTLISQGDVNDAIINAIIDFTHTAKQSKAYNIFEVSVTNTDNKLFVVGIGVADNKYTQHPKIGSELMMISFQQNIL